MGAADFTLTEDSGARVVRFSGALTLAEVRDLPERLGAIDGPVQRVDLSQAARIDTIGAWIVRRFAREHGATIDGASPVAPRRASPPPRRA